MRVRVPREAGGGVPDGPRRGRVGAVQEEGAAARYKVRVISAVVYALCNMLLLKTSDKRIKRKCEINKNEGILHFALSYQH